jgi:hypothetical protein
MTSRDERQIKGGDDATQDPQSPDVLSTRQVALDRREADLSRREQALQARTKEIDEKAARLEELKREVADLRKRVEQDQAALAKRQRDVALAEGALEERARVVAAKELEAEAGFAKKSREVLAELTKSHLSLREELKKVQEEIDAARLRGVADLDKWLAEQRRARQEALDAEMADARRRLENALQEESMRVRSRIAEELQEHEAALKEARQRLASEQRVFEEEVARKRAALGEKEAELHRELEKARFRIEELDARRAEIERAAEERARDRVSSLERQLRDLREDHNRTLDLRADLERRLEVYRQLELECGGSVQEIIRKRDDAEARCAALEKELLSRPSASDKERLVALQEQHRTWSEERERLLFEITQLRAERYRWHVGVKELEAQREQREVAERRLEVLRGEMEKYAAEVDRMRSLYEKPQEIAARIGEIETPLWEDLKRAPVDETLTEVGWLERIAVACGESGFRFPKRLVYQFHTALKTAELSPFTVLAGVSGTGKSALPRLYAHFGGLAFHDVAVQPNWDSPQSLFGFFNSIDNRYNATELLRAVVQSQKAPKDESYKHGFSDRLLLVLLDEMNLAHVEHYFSEQISRLGKPLVAGQNVVVPIDLGAGMKPYQLQLGRNILWVGTMNEDETTKTLSDKVIDRSNLLFFPRPRTLFSRADVGLGAAQPLLPRKTWESWTRTRSPFAPEDVAIYRGALESMNGHLEHVGRALGHRVWQSVEYYLANHPEVIDAQRKNDRDALTRAMRRAFEDQLVLKVMPKLRGIETTGDAQRKCLDPIRKQLDDQNLGLRLAEDFEIACHVGYGAFVWNSARYLEADE